MIEDLRRKVLENQVEFSRHAVDQAIRRGITVAEAREAFACGELIEDYPEAAGVAHSLQPSVATLGQDHHRLRTGCGSLGRSTEEETTMSGHAPKETLVEQRVTYTLEMDGRFYIVENVPARVCLETGEQLFSPHALERLRQLNASQRPARTVQTAVFDFAA